MGQYQQPCSCVSRANGLMKDAENARVRAYLAPFAKDSHDARIVAAFLLRKAARAERWAAELVMNRLPCKVCGDTKTVRGNGAAQVGGSAR